jgi:hypothetical protein
VSDPNSGVASSSTPRQWIAPGRGRWIALVVLVAVLVAGFFIVRYLSGIKPAEARAEISVEESWNKTIANLGITPIFPPEEDLVVGDVLAAVVRDVYIQTNADALDIDTGVARKAFVSRPVKLAHVDVSKELDDAYGNLPVFPATIGANPPFRSGVARAFSDAVLLSNVPRAAFPRLKIQGVSNAAAGVAADGKGSASYGAGSQEIEEFELSDVRTYGLPSVAALKVFTNFCDKPETAEVCLEATARKHLEQVVGDVVSRKFLDLKSGDYRYAIEVQIVMVYRVYLTSSIVDLRRMAASQKGGLMALWPFGSSQDAAPAAPAPYRAPANPVTLDGSTAEQVQALTNRLADVEQKLSKAKSGGTLAYESSYGRESALEGKFERPVAIGYRSVKRRFAVSKPPESSQ